VIDEKGKGKEEEENWVTSDMKSNIRYLHLSKNDLTLPEILDGKLIQLHQGPIFSHILGAQGADFLIQMGPEDGSKPVHETLHLLQTQLDLPGTTTLEIVLQLIHAGMDFLVLLQQARIAAGELGHFLRQVREQHLLFDGVMHGQRRAEIESLEEELLNRETCWSLVIPANVIELVPGLSKAIMIEIHLFGQPVVNPELCGRECGLWLVIITLLRRVIIHMRGLDGDAFTPYRG